MCCGERFLKRHVLHIFLLHLNRLTRLRVSILLFLGLRFVCVLEKIEKEVAAGRMTTCGEKLHPALPTYSVQLFLRVERNAGRHYDIERFEDFYGQGFDGSLDGLDFHHGVHLFQHLHACLGNTPSWIGIASHQKVSWLVCGSHGAVIEEGHGSDSCEDYVLTRLRYDASAPHKQHACIPQPLLRLHTPDANLTIVHRRLFFRKRGGFFCHGYSLNHQVE
mmetsp:Transcript_10207/g.21282  ORF Transcript_10207/g.21282 Transcript_10207/m.21282 type:complete len:220 (-) Transcript_10207:92-751(-)